MNIVAAIVGLCGAACLSVGHAQVSPIPGNILSDADPALESGNEWKKPSTYVEATVEPLGIRGANGQYSARTVSLLTFDERGDYGLTDAWRLSHSLRLSSAYSDRPTTPAVGSHLYVRELFAEFQSPTLGILEVGRVNLRNGTAYSFNPTDFLRRNAILDVFTRDSATIREERLGAVMLSTKQFFSSATVSAALVPKLANLQGLRVPTGTLNPRLGQSNGANEGILKVGVELSDHVSPDLLIRAREGESPVLGASAAWGVGSSTTLYVEFAGAKQRNLYDRAIEFGVKTGDLASGAANLASRVQSPSSSRWRNDLVFGTTWSPTSEWSTIAEFFYREGGYSKASFLADRARAPLSPASQLANYVLNYSGARQEPLARQGLFLRAQWDGIQDVSLNAFVLAHPADHSGVVQAAVDYHYSPQLRIRGYVSSSYGGEASIYGASSTRRSIFLAIACYL